MYKQRLKEYVEIDHIYEQYKDGDIPNPSDFEEFAIQHCKDIEDLLNEVEDIEEKYNKRSKKWEKWETEKSILSTKMSDYLCKYQNIKREYTKQIQHATEKKKELARVKEENNQLEKDLKFKEAYIIQLEKIIYRLVKEEELSDINMINIKNIIERNGEDD